jgi:hypothetical protein
MTFPNGTLGWADTSVEACFGCKYVNNDVASNNAHAHIVCINVP